MRDDDIGPLRKVNMFMQNGHLSFPKIMVRPQGYATRSSFRRFRLPGVIAPNTITRFEMDAEVLSLCNCLDLFCFL